MSMNHNTQVYPTIPQAWGIFAILLAAQVVASPIQLVLGKESGLGLFLMYTVALSIGLAFALWNKSQRTTQLLTPIDSFESIEVQPLVEQKSVPFIIYPLSVLAIPGLVMISAPIANLIPVPDFFMEQLESIVGGDIGVFHFLTIVIAAALFEETIFRGIILDGFLRLYSPQKAIIYSALLFALVHMNPLQFPHTMILGLFLGWLYYRTKSIWPCIAIHMINNGSVFFLASGMKDIDTSAVEEPTQWSMLLAIPFGMLLLYTVVQLLRQYLPDLPSWQLVKEVEEEE